MNNEHPMKPVSAASDSRPLPRLRFPFLCVASFWTETLVAQHLDKLYFFGFIFTIITSALFTLLFVGWWFFNKQLSRRDKVAGFLVMLLEAIMVGKLSHKTVSFFTLWSVGLPVAVSLIVLLIFLAKRYPIPLRACFLLGMTGVWAFFLTFRAEGLDSSLKANVHWRWTPTAEQRFLTQQTASRPKKPFAAAETSGGAVLDWPSFRGPRRDGVVKNSRISTNWSASPPALVWKRKVGPAWSSMIIVGGRLITQEQRGEKELTVCYDAQTGEEVWLHEETARFEETVSGPGPRATPTWDGGRIYSLGGTGLLTCLNSTNGQLIWGADIRKDSGAKTPNWAFSSSPLIVGGQVIVYAGGTENKALAAYAAENGKLTWSAPCGQSSYSSAEELTIDGVQQCLMLHDGGLTSVDPANGKVLWETGKAWKGGPRSGQPRLVGSNSLVVGAMDGMGTSRVLVKKMGDKWTLSPTWISNELKPEFPDFVISGGYAYGFDVSLFACLNLEDGRRSWKDGRYGRGQVMLLEDQHLLLVTSETGELILLALDPTEHRELGRIQAIEGKTWAHAVVLGSRIYLRNAEEMACYDALKK